VTCRTDCNALRAVFLEPLEIDEPIVRYEFIRMPDSTGFGDYTESGQVIAVHYGGQRGAYVHSMYLNDEAPIAGGRELWGFPKKLASPALAIDKDTLIGILDYGRVRIAIATMGHKHRALDIEAVRGALAEPNYLLKIIPHVDGSPRICELVRYHRAREDQGRLVRARSSRVVASRARACGPASGTRSDVRHAPAHRSHAWPRHGRPRLPERIEKRNGEMR
jgi:acetoacetate decarboxylase